MTNTRLTNRNRALLAATTCIAIGAGATACGRVAPLEQPPPLFGARAKAQYYAQRQDQQTQTANRSTAQRNAQGSAETAPDNALGGNSTDPNENDAPLTTRDVQDPETKLTSPRDSPIPGAPNPLGPTPSLTPQGR